MIRMTVRFTHNRPAGVLLSVLLLSLLLNGSAAAVERPDALLWTAGADFMPRSSGRHFYLTNASYTGNQVLTACATGYHMASFWEIQDVSDLTYDYAHPAAHTKADSGFGPPSYWYGWVRTGQVSAGTNTAGMGNCLTWTVSDSNNYGVTVRLTRTWETPSGEIGPWDATAFTCNTTGPVWCVGYFSVMYLPMVAKN